MRNLAISLAVLALPRTIVAQDLTALSPTARSFVVDSEPLIAFRHARVIDGTGAPIREGQTVLVKDGKIIAAGDDALVPIPAGAEEHDLTGATIIPGLFDLHAHMYFFSNAGLTEMAVSGPRLYLAAGVTTARTAGGQLPYADLIMKRDIDRGRAPGPRLLITGPYLGGPGEGPGLNRRLETPEEARRVVAYWAEEGATWLKFSGSVSRAVLGAAIQEAHRHGMKVTGHLCSVSFREAAALGIDNLEHGFITNSDYLPNRVPDQCSPENMRYQEKVSVESPAVDSTIRDLLAHKVALTSTLAVYQLFVPGQAKLSDQALEVLSPRAREAALADLKATNERTTFVVEPTLFEKMKRFERKWVDAGGLLAAGVDPWGNGSLPGFGDHQNYRVLLEAGFTPVEAIRIMTANGATVLGMINETGTITVGKRADLVIIDGNPAADPGDIAKVRWVFRDGIGYDSAKLLASVKGMVGIQ